MVPLRLKYIPQAKRRLATPQTPQAVKQIIYSCGVYQKHVHLFITSPSIVHQNVKDASFVRDRRTKSTDLLAINVTTPSAKNTAR